MYYFGIKPHVDLKRRKIESMNELFILCASYHIIVISDFNTKQESLETIGSSFIAVLLLLVVFNVFAVTHKILTSFRLRKILLQKKRFMDKKLREVKQSIKNRTGSLRVDVSDVDSEAGSRDSQSDSV